MKFIFSLLVAVLVGSLSCSAADLDSSDYYSLSPTVNSALDYSVMPLDLSSTESGWLQGIYQTLVNSTYLNKSSILGNLQDIVSNVVSISSSSSSIKSDVDDLRSGLVGTSNSVLWYAREIYNDTSELHNIYLSASSSALSLEEINDAIQNDYDSLKELLKSIWGDTESVVSWLNGYFPIYFLYSSGVLNSYNDTLLGSYAKLVGAFTFDGINVGIGGRTIYGLIAQLQQVLASDDDLVLANSQKANREQIESTFLNGSSGSTSLGVSDFGDLADVGGTIKDSLSLDGNATIGSFTSGLAAADSAGLGWFSEETRSQLDAVSSTVTYSLRDSDPYNMDGWEDRYYWLLGDDE